MPEVPADAIIADEAIAPVPEVAAAEPEDWDAEIAAAPTVVPAELGDDELNHEQVVNHLLRNPYLQELALFRCMMPILEETRKKLQKTEKKFCERVCYKLYTYSSALETSATVHYERATAKYGAHTSMGDEPSTNLCDWIKEMRQSPYSFAAQLMDDPTRYDVIVLLQEKLELMEERDAQRDGEMDTLRVLRRLEQRKRLLSDDILEEALEERVAGAAQPNSGPTFAISKN